MPSTELGLAAIEERLRELCRRSNQRVALHAASVATSVVALSAALRIGLGAARFQGLPFWVALAACAAGVAWAWRYCRERWLDVASAARLADHEAGMNDRLVTLLALAPQVAARRFFPVLLSQSLDLGERWQAQRLVPKPYPRTIYAALLSLLLLLGSPLLEPEAPPPSPQEGASASTSTETTRLSGEPQGPEEPGESPREQRLALAGGGGSSDEAGEAGQREGAEAKGGGAAADGKQGLGERSGKPPAGPGKDSESGSTARAARQGGATAGATGASEPGEGGKAGEKKGEDREGNSNSPQEPDDRKSGEGQGASKRSPGGQSLPQSASDAALPPPGLQAKQIAAPSPANGGKGEKSTPAPDRAKGEGLSGAAGTGSDSGTLLTVRGSNASAQGPSVDTFKLTLDSFLDAIANKDRGPRQDRKPGPEGPAETSVSVEASERQMADDPMRKVPIPAEYEEIVKRVYAHP